jgi:hypothetical protein
VNDPAQAKLVEVGEGTEATGIDIKLGPLGKTFAASGRVVEAATGQPVRDTLIDFDAVDKQGNRTQSFGVGNSLDERGEFRFNGLKPGR